MTSPPPHPPWLREPAARWRIRVSDAAVYLVILTAAAGTSVWSLRWIPPVMTWGEPLRFLTRPGHTAALLLSGHAPGESVILMSWPWLAPCMLLNALLLWGPALFLRSSRVPPLPVFAWTGAALLASAAIPLATGWSPAG